MSRGLSANWPTAAFGDLEQAIWGVAVGGPSPLLAIGTPAGPQEVMFDPARIEVDPDAGDWIVASDAATVRVSMAALPGSIAAGEERRISLCRVTGTVAGDHDQRAIDLGGWQCEELPTGKLDSIRLVGAWFAAGDGVALIASRPQGASGQDRDAIGVALLGDKDATSVSDPRLSTTYDRDGAVRRVGIELWLGRSDDEDQYPRRVAGDRAGPMAAATIAAVRLQAVALRCHTRGGDGLGVYLLVRQA